MRYQLTCAAVLLAACSFTLTGCVSRGAQPPGSPTDVAPAPAATAPLEAGDTRFLLGQGNLIESVTLSGQESRLIELDERVNVLEMALSADRSQLAFVVELPAYTTEDGSIDFGADLYVSDADGTNARLILEHESTGEYFEAPSWLSDSTLLVGARGADPVTGRFNRIEQVDIATATHEVVLDNAAMGAISRDGRSIVYTAIDPQTRVQRLLIEDLTADDTPRVLVDEYDGLALFTAVTFSPDGSRLAFAAVDLGTTAPPPMPPKPQGATFALTSSPPLLHPFAEDAWLIDPADGTGLRRIAEITENMPSLTWTSDGSHLYALGPNFLWRLDPAASTGEMLRQSTGRGAIIWLEGS